MPKQKIISELDTEISAKERQLAQLQHRQQQLENRRSYYEKGDRRKRAHRLITRGAAIESVEPLVKVLTETEFYTFAERLSRCRKSRVCSCPPSAPTTPPSRKGRDNRSRYIIFT